MGWENLFHCEINPFCTQILKYYWPNAVHYSDIKQTDFTPWRGRVDVLSGGFPCQPFSSAGKRKGTADDRYLWPEMLRAIREIEPTWIVGENVRGLVTWNDGMVFEQVCADLEAEGYEVQAFVIPAAGVNAPHRRERVWFIAYADRSRHDWRGQRQNGESGKRTICENINDDRFEVRSQATTCSTVTSDADRSGHRSDYEFGQNRPASLESEGFGQEWKRVRTVTGGNGSEETTSDPFSLGFRRESDGEGEPKLPSQNEQKRAFANTDSDKRPSGGELDQQSRQAPSTNGCRHVGHSNGQHASTKQSVSSGPGPEPGRIRNLSDTNPYNERLEKPRCQPQQQKTHGEFGVKHKNGSRAWSEFPTQSPLRSRDDGFPTRLDGITVSKLRTESIKGFGNAVVPQVVYRIFLTILFS
nr:DNA (cytosine-5-)-methyltransferase [Siphonobacter curvatus]